MAAQRLTSAAVDLIVDGIVGKAIKKQREALEEQRYDLCHAVYDERITKPYGALMAQLPDGLFRKNSSALWNIVPFTKKSETNIRLNFRDSMPGGDYWTSCDKTDPKDPNRFAFVTAEEAKKIHAVDRALATLNAGEDEERNKARSALKAHKTFEGLEAAWPEVYDLVPGLTELRTKHLPAVIADMTSLRAMALAAGLKAAA